MSDNKKLKSSLSEKEAGIPSVASATEGKKKVGGLVFFAFLILAIVWTLLSGDEDKENKDKKAAHQTGLNPDRTSA